MMSLVPHHGQKSECRNSIQPMSGFSVTGLCVPPDVPHWARYKKKLGVSVDEIMLLGAPRVLCFHLPTKTPERLFPEPKFAVLARRVDKNTTAFPCSYA